MAIINTLKSKRDEANKIVNEIIEQSKIIEKNVNKSKTLLSNVDTNSNKAKKLKSSLNRIISSTNAAILKFRNQRDKVSRLLTQVNNFYNKKYIPLVEKIDNDETGFKARLKQGTAFKNETSRIKDLSKKQYEEVKTYATELRKTSKELRKVDTSVRKLFQNSLNKNTEINKIQSNVKTLENQIKILHKELDKIFITSQKNSKTIFNLLKKSNKEYTEIESIKTDSKKILTEIQGIYGIAAETGLSGEFDKRRTQLKELIKKWEKRIFITSLVLLIMIVLMFILQLMLYNWDLTNHTFDINFYVRFLIASPVVYYLYFCSKQFNQAKKLHDKYSFKTTLAMSIKSHIELLTKHEKFNEKERIDKILEFVLDGFQRIYSEPYSEDDYNMKLKLANIEVDIEKRILETITKTLNIATVKQN
jgi:hypothetical protein